MSRIRLPLAAAFIVLFAFCPLCAQEVRPEAGAEAASVTPAPSAAPDEADLPLDAAPPERAEEALLPIEGENAFSQGPSSFFAVLRMFLALLLVAAVIYFFVFFLKRLTRPQAEQNPHLRILASTHLGGGRFVHVISVGTRAYLIGSGEGGVNHIADLDDREAIDAMLVDRSRRSAEALTPLSSFRELLNKLGGGGNIPPEQDRLDAMRRRRERFKRF